MTTLFELLRKQGSSKEIREWLSTGKIRVRGLPVADGLREVDPAEVTVELRAPRMVPGRDPSILFYDTDIAVVNKPSGWLSVPAPGRRDPHILGWVGRLLDKALAVHRLDEETSGLMIVARTEMAQQRLKESFEKHEIKRNYYAFVRGKVHKETWEVRNELVRDRGDGRRGSGSSGKPAATRFRRIAILRGGAWVEAELETGRTHQVRIHLSEDGLPIWGDELYGGHSLRRWSPRMALHAYYLSFKHPILGKLMQWNIPLPDDLEQLRRKTQFK